jgi:adenylosuccinate lyase
MAPGSLAGLLAEPLSFTGNAVDQTKAFVAEVEAIARRHPEAAAYAPAPIL